MVNHSGFDFGRVKMVHIAFKVAFMVVFILFVCAILFVPIASHCRVVEPSGLHLHSETEGKAKIDFQKNNNNCLDKPLHDG